MTGFTNREHLLSKMRNGEYLDWDIIIIGGGITGAGVLREARRRGYKALLVEQQDFSWGTSSRSSKMVHGGLRYLAAGDIKLTKEFLKGKLHGNMLRYSPDSSKISLVEFKDNFIHGKAIFYNQRGEDSVVQHYKKGELISNGH